MDIAALFIAILAFAISIRKSRTIHTKTVVDSRDVSELKNEILNSILKIVASRRDDYSLNYRLYDLSKVDRLLSASKGTECKLGAFFAEGLRPLFDEIESVGKELSSCEKHFKREIFNKVKKNLDDKVTSPEYIKEIVSHINEYQVQKGVK